MTTETDVVNLAIQHLGAARVRTNLWTEDSKNAAEMRTAYDLMRRSELRRNVWRFSIREMVLRALDTDSAFVTFPTWSNSQAYAVNDVVLDPTFNKLWRCLVANTGNDPKVRDFKYWTGYIGDDVANLWAADTTFMAGELVYDPDTAAGTHTYISLLNSNEGNAVTDTTKWYQFSVGPTRAANVFLYPIGAGPASDVGTKNVFRLPYGFLREAPQAPKQGSQKMLGAPSALFYNDWQYESNYFTTISPGPISYRFAADIFDPNECDPMFIDGFAARLAHQCCEVLTQSTAKLSAIGGVYNKFMSEARIVNGIETGPTEAPEDLYISVRY